MAYGYDPHLAEILRSVQGRLNAPNPGPDYAGMLRATQARLGPQLPQGPGMGFELGPTGPLQTPSVPNFQLGSMGPLQTPRGSVGAGPSGMFNVPTGLKPVLEEAPPTRFAIPGEVPARFEIPGPQSVPYADIRQSMFGPRLTDHVGASTWNSVAPGEFVPGTATTNVSSIPRSVMAPSELELAGLRSGQGALPTWMGSSSGAAGATEQSFLQGLKTNALLKSPAVDATTVGLEAAPTLTGAAKYLDYGKMGLKGIGKGLGGLAISTGANALADTMPLDSNARPGIRAMGNVGGAMFALPAIGGGLAATAAVPGVGGAEAISRSAAGNEVINAGRNASTNPLANLVANAIPVLQWSNIGYKVSDLLNGGDGGINTDNRTNDTVFDVLGGGNNNAAQAAAPTITPEQRLAQTSPDALVKIASDYGLSDAMKQKLVKNYNQAMVMAKATGGAVPLDVSKDGKLSDGSDPKDYPGAKQMPDAQGNKQWVTTNPADVQQHVFQQATTLIPSLGHAQEQEDDFFRKQAVMQSQLEAAMPTLYDAPSWQGDPYAKQLAMTEARAIPSRYVQAQALQAQQAYDNQIAQAMQQQQLAAQYPDLFGKKSNSGQPATLDAAMQNG